MIRVELKWKDINAIIRQLLKEKGIDVDGIVNEHVIYEKDGTITFVYEQDKVVPLQHPREVTDLTSRPSYLKGRG